MEILTDVSYAFALLNERHDFHKAATRWMNSQPSDLSLNICRHAQMGLIRLLSNKTAMDGNPLSLPNAWKVYSDLIQHPSIAFFYEPQGFQPIWVSLCTPFGASPKVLADAYLAAMAIQAGIPLVTFDKDFKAFPGLEIILLEI